MNEPIITRYFENEYEATASFFIRKVSLGIKEAMTLERESSLHRSEGNTLDALTCRLCAAGIYFILKDTPGYQPYNTFCAVMSYDRAAKDADCLGWTALEFLCRTRVVDLLQDCLVLEEEDCNVLRRTIEARDQSLQYNYKRIGELAGILKNIMERIPQVVFDREPNAVTDLFN